MSAELYQLPARPRVTLPSDELNHFLEREMQATELYLDQLAFHLAMVRRGGKGVESDRVKAMEAAEAVLFHILMMQGARTADRKLISELASRENARGTGNAR